MYKMLKSKNIVAVNRVNIVVQKYSFDGTVLPGEMF